MLPDVTVGRTSNTLSESMYDSVNVEGNPMAVRKTGEGRVFCSFDAKNIPEEHCCA
jgi:hypothetical protein